MNNMQIININKNKEENFSYFFINSLIKARIETGIRSNLLDYDEDVTMYLAGILEKFSMPNNVAFLKNNVEIYESEINKRFEKKYDLRDRYNVYKDTADYLMFMFGILNGFNKTMPNYKKNLKLNADVYLGRTKAYYSYASLLIKQIKRSKNVSVAQTLNKLSENFFVYLNLFYQVRDRYLGFVERFTKGEWFHFVYKNIITRQGVNPEDYVKIMDKFLAYLSLWKKNYRNEDKDILRILGAQLKLLNPKFNYDLEKLLAKNAA